MIVDNYSNANKVFLEIQYQMVLYGRQISTIDDLGFFDNTLSRCGLKPNCVIQFKFLQNVFQNIKTMLKCCSFGHFLYFLTPL